MKTYVVYQVSFDEQHKYKDEDLKTYEARDLNELAVMLVPDIAERYARCHKEPKTPLPLWDFLEKEAHVEDHMFFFVKELEDGKLTGGWKTKHWSN